ncbi:hypothetical protein C0992_000928 [Termitomyces sp. T32_za158]|nr:hypothetical protein C0992_000928 [Termitomyces sp. T32_za158]
MPQMPQCELAPGEKGPQYDLEFPGLPPPGKEVMEGQASQCVGKFSFTYEFRQQKESDSTKCHNPPSPSKPCTPKRHTSSADPPFETPVRYFPQPVRVHSPSPSPTPPTVSKNATPQQPLPGSVQHSKAVYSFSRDFTMGTSEVIAACMERARAASMPPSQLGPTSHSTPLPGTTPVEPPTDDPFNLSITAVADSACDKIIMDSPPQLASQECTQKQWVGTGTETPQPEWTWRAAGTPPPPEVYRDVKTKNDTITNATGMQHTAPPHGGWPKIYLILDSTENMIDDLVAGWNSMDTPKL